MKQNWSPNAKWGLFHLKRAWCAAAWTTKGLSALILPQKSRETAFRKLNEYLPPMPESFWNQLEAVVPTEIQKQTRLALNQKPFHFSKFDIGFLTPFQQRVLRATCEIQRGQARSYGWVARRAGSPRGFRAAGQALNRNPIPIFIPCHRVIAGGSRLGGYGGGIEWKIRLLKSEGVGVIRGTEGSYRVQNL